MAIDISEQTEPNRFPASHWVHAEVPNNRHLVTLTGVAILHLEGPGSNWLRERVNLGLRFPTSFFPAGQWFQVEHWAPFVTINAIGNRHHSVNAGWAVDDFGGPGRAVIHNGVGIWADVAVRDSDGWLYRLGYTLTVLGRFVDAPPGPD